jgi:hypothetical protein
MANWPDLPDLTGVVALLYRADWTRLSLAGRVTVENPAPPVTLNVAPGRRFRHDDGNLVVGCDGRQVWQWLAVPPPDGKMGWTSPSIPSFALLCARRGCSPGMT